MSKAKNCICKITETASKYLFYDMNEFLICNFETNFKSYYCVLHFKKKKKNSESE